MDQRRAVLLEAASGLPLFDVVANLVDSETGQYHLPPDFVSGLSKARRDGLDGVGCVVAVVDTGIDEHHPLLRDAILHSRDFTGEGTTTDLNGHGTLVALIVRYVAPGVKFINARALGEDGYGSEEGLAQAMRWTAQYRPTVINMSAGVYFPDLLSDGDRTGLSSTSRDDPELIRSRCGEALQSPVCQAARELAEIDVLVCTASGNCQSQVTCPACDSSAIVVGSVRDGYSNPSVPDYSGLWPDFVAPELPLKEGTSFSTPIVSGMACMIQQAAADLARSTENG